MDQDTINVVLRESGSKATLTEELAELLGFKDGAEDVLEHLLSIESSEDLLVYLSQLLGKDGVNVKSFVDNVARFQRGEPLIRMNDSIMKQQDKNSTRQRQEHFMESAKNNDRKDEGRTQVNKKPAAKNVASTTTKETKRTGKSSTAATPSRKLVSSTIAATKQPPAPKPESLDTNVDTTLPQPKMPQPVPSHPPQGTPKSRQCGCYGTLHKALTNCLYCGRISCIQEGYDFCHFCGFLVSSSSSAMSFSNDGMDQRDNTLKAPSSSWLLKERLLRYDREFVRRTEVVDDQEDYYANTTSTWLTEEEKHDAQDKVENRQQELTPSGKKQLMNLQF